MKQMNNFFEQKNSKANTIRFIATVVLLSFILLILLQTCVKRIRMGMSVLDDQNQSTVITAGKFTVYAMYSVCALHLSNLSSVLEFRPVNNFDNMGVILFNLKEVS